MQPGLFRTGSSEYKGFKNCILYFFNVVLFASPLIFSAVSILLGMIKVIYFHCEPLKGLSPTCAIKLLVPTLDPWVGFID